MYIQAVNRSVNALCTVCMFQVKLLFHGKLAFMHVLRLVHQLLEDHFLWQSCCLVGSISCFAVWRPCFMWVMPAACHVILLLFDDHTL